MKANRAWKYLFSPRSKSSGWKLILRMGIIGAASLILGTLYQHFSDKGMPFRLLALPLCGTSAEAAWKPVSSDSAFVHFLRKSAVFVDVRKRAEFDLDHIPGAVSVPFVSFFRDPRILADSDPQATYILVDFEAQSRLPRMMIQVLKKRGFHRVFFLRNGYAEWLEMGFPRESGGPS